MCVDASASFSLFCFVEAFEALEKNDIRALCIAQSTGFMYIFMRGSQTIQFNDWMLVVVHDLLHALVRQPNHECALFLHFCFDWLPKTTCLAHRVIPYMLL